MLSKKEGDFLLKLARESIDSYIMRRKVMDVPADTPKSLKENMGAFVTLNEKGLLRGCIGYSEPVKPLVNSVIEVAVSAAVGDPRFPPVTADEICDIKIEVSVLTKPELIDVKRPEEYIDKINIGENGLIVERGSYKGLLLPQVAVEHGWNVEEFLYNTCVKAGLTSDCWLYNDVKVYKFSSQIFDECE